MTDSVMDYHDDFSHVSRTMLTVHIDSPLVYYHTYVTRAMTPKKPSKPMITGTLLHAIFLEGRQFSDLVVTYPADCLKSDGSINSKPAKAFASQHPGMYAMKEDEAFAVFQCASHIEKHGALKAILDEASHMERRVDAKLYGINCKCKPDILADSGDHIIIYDFKCVGDPSPEHFRRSSKRFKYWLQDAHYSAVCAAAFGKPVSFAFLVQEVTFPFRLQRYFFPPATCDEARDLHRKALDDLRRCMETNDWSDRWEQAVPLAQWDMASSDREEMVEAPDYDA